MKLLIRAGGIIRSGPERELINDYMKRTNQLARQRGYPQLNEIEVDLKRAKSRREQTEKILNNIPSGTKRILLDERGKSLRTKEMAHQVQSLIQDGCSELQFVIGPADGFDKDLIAASHLRWRLGAQTWPHKLLRVMLTEQIYRIYSLWAATPYHRE